MNTMHIPIRIFKYLERHSIKQALSLLRQVFTVVLTGIINLQFAFGENILYSQVS
jgi:hypothetical protein